MGCYEHYRIAGYFREVLIFVIFVVHLGVTKFSIHVISTHCVALSTHAQIWTNDVLLRLFATCRALGPQGLLSQAVPRVRAEEVNREV